MLTVLFFYGRVLSFVIIIVTKSLEVTFCVIIIVIAEYCQLYSIATFRLFLLLFCQLYSIANLISVIAEFC